MVVGTSKGNQNGTVVQELGSDRIACISVPSSPDAEIVAKGIARVRNGQDTPRNVNVKTNLNICINK